MDWNVIAYSYPCWPGYLQCCQCLSLLPLLKQVPQQGCQTEEAQIPTPRRLQKPSPWIRTFSHLISVPFFLISYLDPVVGDQWKMSKAPSTNRLKTRVEMTGELAGTAQNRSKPRLETAAATIATTRHQFVNWKKPMATTVACAPTNCWKEALSTNTGDTTGTWVTTGSGINSILHLPFSMNSSITGEERPCRLTLVTFGKYNPPTIT